MKISEIIRLLEEEKKKRGDVEVLLHGHYGAVEKTFDVIDDKNLLDDQRPFLNIWTDIMTG